jgi:hypothetical protein
MNLYIHQTRLRSKDTNHEGENATNSSLSPAKDLDLEIVGPFHDDSFNAFVVEFDNHKSKSSLFGK